MRLDGKDFSARNPGRIKRNDVRRDGGVIPQSRFHSGLVV
jgi:hypothetical protein